ncbi:MAG: glycosyltransferase family 4 protein [Acidimicrobiales bacterium]
MSTRERTSPQRSLRIAFVTPEPVPGGGVPGMAVLVARGLAQLGHEVDCWTVPETSGPRPWAEVPGLTFRASPGGFRWGRWYSGKRTPAMVTSLVQLGLRAAATRTLGRRLVEEHRRCPYDVVYRFSTIELLGLRRHLPHLPPLVVHPEVHAAGELRWAKAEAHLSRRCHSRPQRTTLRALLELRARRQRRDIRRAALVIAPSERFAELVAGDYELPAARFAVVPNPVDLCRFQPAATSADRPIRLIYVGRAAVRKGIELVVDLSHRLDDLAGRVELQVVATHSLWSDYRPLLTDANPRIAVIHPATGPRRVAALMADSDLLLQPSHYEPFALTVAEALATGTPVVVTDEVGAGEHLDPRCATVVPAGDPAALEQAVRARVAELEAGEAGGHRAVARAEAERRFAPGVVSRALADVLRRAADPVAAGGPA